MSEEAELIDAALEGDTEAFGRLVQTHQDRLFGAMLQVTRSAEEAEDVVQEAFVRAYVKLHTFQRNSRFFTWLYRIAFNSALSRRRRKRATISLDQTREVTGIEPIDVVDAPDERMLQGERVNMVRAALDRLSDEHRAIMVLRELENHAYEDIAEILEISIGTVRSRLNRARTQLRQTLEAMRQAEEPSEEP
ncbi:RNA polymerase sigma factor [Roseimaritima ulvae]|uniref:RNA polymerase sigma factor n=1 Tax=Roseimaritima ulvae TaxID=980254 RepID=A0A5B9QL83_9BACT|nr:sigma-70 family RNA polymerase sigma factor [Roseimaritima ulvae]QEG38779.1 ECF RNA polymerase sigma factor SigW [Roseimaritima ulvae]